MTDPQTTKPDRFISPCAPPEGWEREIITIAIEECAEVAQRATKMLRFGVLEVQPGQRYTNAERLGEEVGDLLTVLDLCINARLIDFDAVERGRAGKRHQLRKFMQHPEVVDDQT